MVALPVDGRGGGGGVDAALLHLLEQQLRGRVLGAEVGGALELLPRRRPVALDEGVDAFRASMIST